MRGCLLTFAVCSSMLAGCAQSTDPSPASTVGAETTAKPAPKPSPAAGGIYFTPAKAYRMWQTNPTRGHILDVRTPAEFLFAGRATMARNIPVMFPANRWDADFNRPAWTLNDDFVAAAGRHYKTDDAILVMCRSSTRSLKAVSILKAAGYANVHNIRGGFEGEIAEDCNCPNVDDAAVDGWKASGLPWTMKIDKTLIYIAPRPRMTPVTASSSAPPSPR